MILYIENPKSSIRKFTFMPLRQPWEPGTMILLFPLQPYGLQPTRLHCPWGFSRQEYYSGLPCPPPGDLPNPGTEPRSPSFQADSLATEPPGKPETQGTCACLFPFYWLYTVLKSSFYPFLRPTASKRNREEAKQAENAALSRSSTGPEETKP